LAQIKNSLDKIKAELKVKADSNSKTKIMETLTTLKSNITFCKNTTILKNKNGKLLTPILNADLEIRDKMIASLSLLAGDNENLKAEVSSIKAIQDIDNGYEQSCQPIISIISSNFKVNGDDVFNKIAKANIKKNDKCNYWIQAKLNSQNNLEVKCLVGTCPDLVNTSYEQKVEAKTYANLNLNFYCNENSNKYFGYYTFEKTVGDSKVVEKKYDFFNKDFKSNNSACNLLNACVSRSNNANCFPKMNTECEKFLNDRLDRSNSGDVMNSTLVSAEVPFNDLTVPTSNFLKCAENIIGEGFITLNRNIMSNFSVNVVNCMTLSNATQVSTLRLLADEFSSDLDTEANDNYQPKGSVEIDGASETKDADPNASIATIDAKATVFVDDKKFEAEITSTTSSTSDLSSSYYYINFMILLVSALLLIEN